MKKKTIVTTFISAIAVGSVAITGAAIGLSGNSNTSSNSSIPDTAESSSEVTTASESVSIIQKATDNAISKISETTNSAVSDVKAAKSETVSTVSKAEQAAISSSAAVAHKIIFGKNEITFDYPDVGEGKILHGTLQIGSGCPKVDIDNKYVIFGYGGSLPRSDCHTADGLKALGFTLKSASGANIEFTNGGNLEIKVPFNDLSDVSEMYLTYKDQSIKITVV